MSLNKLSLKFGKFFIANIPKSIKAAIWRNNTLTLTVEEESLLFVCQFLKKQTNLQFKTIIDIVAIDYPFRAKRFSLVYNFLSVQYNERLFIRLNISSLFPVSSLASLFPASIWFEREVWDMFGIFFINNPDLRRILTDYGFEGHPFRKDFPLTGYTELRYDENQKRIISEKIEISQEYRVFDFLSV